MDDLPPHRNSSSKSIAAIQLQLIELRREKAQLEDSLRFERACRNRMKMHQFPSAHNQDQNIRFNHLIQQKLKTMISPHSTKSGTKHALLNQLHVYRLAGRSVFRMKEPHTEKDILGIRWDTSFQGRPMDKFYLLLEWREKRAELKVYKHTIPSFLPVQDLAKKHLNTNIKVLSDFISDALHAFVNRREQVQEAQARAAESSFIEMSSLDSTESASMTSFILLFLNAEQVGKQKKKTKPQAAVEVFLQYDDLQAIRPTRVSIQSIPLKSVRETFKKRRLEAFPSRPTVRGSNDTVYGTGTGNVTVNVTGTVAAELTMMQLKEWFQADSMQLAIERVIASLEAPQ